MYINSSAESFTDKWYEEDCLVYRNRLQGERKLFRRITRTVGSGENDPAVTNKMTTDSVRHGETENRDRRKEISG